MTKAKQTESTPDKGQEPQIIRGFFIPGPMLQTAVDQIQGSTSPNRTVMEVNQLLQGMMTLPPATFKPGQDASPATPPKAPPNRANRRKAAAKPRGRRPKKG